jgi:hypothetical protein
MRRTGFRTGLLLGAFFWVAVSPAFGAAADDTRNDTGIVNFASFSIASLSRLADEAKDLGIELPPTLTAPGLERQFPMIPADGLDADRPIGVFSFAGLKSATATGQSYAVAFPVKNGAATLKSFLDAGGKPLGGGSGAVELNGAFYRRTPSYLIISPIAQAAIDVREADLLDPYRPPQTGRNHAPDGLLARISVDLDAVRQADASRFQQLIEQLKFAGARGNYPTPAMDMLVGFAMQGTRLDVALVRNGNDLSLRIGVAPVRVPAGGTFARPGMPQEVIVRLDMGAPPLQVLPWVESVFGQYVPAVQQDDFVHHLADVLLAGQAVSVGLEPRGDSAIFYMVQQQVKADPIARLKQLAEQANLAADATPGKANANRMDISQYTTDSGLHVTRVKLMEGKTCKFCVDVVRQADTVYLTGSTDLGRYLPSLIPLKPDGQFSGLISGSINLAAALEIVSDAAGNKLPPAQLKSLHEILKGRSLTLTATGGGDEAFVGVSLPRDLIKDLVATFYAAPAKP